VPPCYVCQSRDTRSQAGAGRNLKVLPVWPRIAKQATDGTSRAIGTRSMSEFGTELARLMAARGLGVRELARIVPCNPGHISNLRSGKASASPELAERLDDVLGTEGELVALVPAAARRRMETAVAADDEIAALELARRIEASDVGSGTVERLELIVDDLAVAYPATRPAELLTRIRTHLGYVGSLLDARATLNQHRRLLVTGGWLSLLAATCLIDLHSNHAAEAYLRTADQLADETGQPDLAAWVLETRAWQALTAGEFRRAAALSQAAQLAAPHASSAHLQAVAQEGRAWARAGDPAETRRALTRLETLVSPLPGPDRPEHHYRYDSPKSQAYVATTLAWAGDAAAEGITREVLAAIEAPGAAPARPRRAALARLDLALALTASGKDDEAAATALQAVSSGRLAPVDGRRVRDIIRAVAASHVPGVRELAEAYYDDSAPSAPSALP
jgi:transcriptional regulator with XRE-family HTH domain